MQHYITIDIHIHKVFNRIIQNLHWAIQFGSLILWILNPNIFILFYIRIHGRKWMSICMLHFGRCIVETRLPKYFIDVTVSITSNYSTGWDTHIVGSCWSIRRRYLHVLLHMVDRLEGKQGRMKLCMIRMKNFPLDCVCLLDRIHQLYHESGEHWQMHGNLMGACIANFGQCLGTLLQRRACSWWCSL